MKDEQGFLGRRAGMVIAVVLAGAAVVAVILVLQASPSPESPSGGRVKALPGGNRAARPATTGWPGQIPIPPVETVDLQEAADAAGCELREPPNEGSDHTSSLDTRVTYKANPPTSGAHFALAAEDGAYLVAPQAEQTVHSLEHGRIDIQWNPGARATDDDVAGLKALYDEDPYHLLLFPNQTAMAYAVAATAWDHSLVCEEFDTPAVWDAIRAFRDTYRDKGPEKVP
jgi:hypothetical protein